MLTAMISIKKHLQDAEPQSAHDSGQPASAQTRPSDSMPGEEPSTRRALEALVDNLIETTREHMPAPDAESHERFRADLGTLGRELKSRSDAAQIDLTSRALSDRLTDQWEQVEAGFANREKELGGVITVLAETAGHLDSSNRTFYLGLHRTVEHLGAVGQIEDISALRQALSDHLGKLESTVKRQEAESRKAFDRMDVGFESAQSKVEAFGKFVHTESLAAMPSRRHAETYITELIGRERPFRVAVVKMKGIDAVDRRYGEVVLGAVLEKFSRRLSEGIPSSGHLYRWAPGLFLVIDEQTKTELLRGQLAEFLRGPGSQPLTLDDGSGREVRLHPHSIVHSVDEGAAGEAVTALVERFHAAE